MDLGIGRLLKLVFVDLFALSFVLVRLSCPSITPPPPELTVSPSSITIEAEESTLISASSNDPGDVLSWVSDNPGVAVVFEGNVSALSEGNATVTVSASNSGLSQDVPVTVLPRTTPRVAPDAPEVFGLGPVTNQTSITVMGMTDPDAMIEINGAVVAKSRPVNSDGSFEFDVNLQLNRINRLFVTAIGPTGLRSAPATLAITQDNTPPGIFIDFPSDGSAVFDAEVDVAGRVSDLLSGFLGIDVTVNGLPADVDVGLGTNGTFLRTAVPLVLGANVITATATDAAGNSANASITITRSTLTGPRLSVSSGNRQMGQVLNELGQPVVVQVLDESNQPVVGCNLTWTVKRSDGRLSATTGAMPEEMTLETVTDAQGQSQAFWTLGTDAGCGNNRLHVTADCALNTAFVCATATPGPPSQINIGSGNRQKAEINSPVPLPLNVWVSDGTNGIPNVPVTFEITAGDGTFFGDPSAKNTVIVNTDATGHAEVDYSLGNADGHNKIDVTIPEKQVGTARFDIVGLVRQFETKTTFVGRVLDNASCPIGGAAVVLEVGGQTLQTASTVEGAFSFEDTGDGFAELSVDGSVATSLNGQSIPQGTFPSLHYETLIVPDTENALGMPVLLPPLDPANERTYDGTQDVELTVAGVDGLKMTIKAGSMRLADGSTPSPGNPAIAKLNQVHADDIPMPFPDGTAPRFAWTLQPSGATFDPPVSIEYPNMNGLPPGAVVEFMSFNHDTGMFEIVATGTVSLDGAIISTDPGSGIGTAGWGTPRRPDATGDGRDECGLVGVVLFAGGVEHRDAIVALLGGDATEGFQDLARDLRAIDPSKVRAKVVRPSSILGIQVLGAELWLQQLRNNRPPNCDEPKVLLVGHSLGGDTVRIGGIDADRRIAMDPISRDVVIALPFDCKPYQRNLTFAAPPNMKSFLAGDLPGETIAMCAVGCSLGGVGTCLRGYHMSGTVEESVLPGANHGSIVGFSRQHVINEVQELLEQVPRTGKSTYKGLNGQAFIDETFTLMVGGQSYQPDESGFFFIENISAPDQFGLTGPGSPSDLISDDYVRMTGVGEFDGEACYVFSDPFRITQGQTSIIGNLTFSHDPPPVPVSITATPDAPTLVAIGAMTTVRVSGTFAGGVVSDVTGAAGFTTYRSSNERIVTVGIDGVVTAKRPGTVFISANNFGATSVTRITVAPDATLTAVVGTAQTTGMQPVENAAVRPLNLGGMDTSDAGGAFRVVGVASDQGPIAVVAQKLDPSGALVGISATANPVPDGDTNVGTVTMQTLCEISPGDCVDSDNDGVIDSAEGLLGFIVGNPDSNGNGIPDGFEDLDGDGLSVIAEFLLGTFDTSADTDNDGLTDSEEVLLGLDPTNPDGDGDGLLDGEDDDPFTPDAQIPAVSLLSPMTGTDLLEDSVVTLTARVIDNGRITQVVFNVGGTPFATIDVIPGANPEKAVDTQYEADFMVPMGVTDVTFEIEATDTAMNTGTTGPILFNVVDDPLTTVIGTVQDGTGTPIANADVTAQGESATTLVNGTFSIPNVPTNNGDIVVTAKTAVGVVPSLTGSSAPTTPVLGGTTNVGTITLQAGSLFQGRKYPIAGQPSDVAVGDFNEDGFSDAVATIFVPANVNQTVQRLAMYLGNGDGTMGDAQFIELSTLQVTEVEAVFLDGDTHLDLVVGQASGSGGTTGELRAFLGDGTGSFAPAVVSTTAQNNKMVAMKLADFDEDTHLDVITSTKLSGAANSLEILFGDSTGAFTTGGLIDTLGEVAEIAVGDLNKDNAPDIVVVNDVVDTVSFLINNNDDTGTFEAVTTAIIEAGGFQGPESVTIADIDEDTNPDIIAAFLLGPPPSIVRGGLLFALGNGDGTFQFQTSIQPVASPWGPVFVQADDVNNDSTADLIAIDSNGGVTSLIGVGNGTFEPANVTSGGAMAFVAATGTFDNNNTKDLAIINRTSNDLLISFGDGDGTFTPAPESVVLLDLALPVDVAVDFLDSDAFPDVMTANHFDDQVAVALGSMNGLQAPQLVTVGDAPTSIVSGLFNNDAFVDMVVANQDSDDLSVLLGNNDGTFQAPTSIALSANDKPATVVAGLLNGDAFLDLVVTLEGAGAVKTLLGNGDGTFQSPVSTATSGLPREITLADIDGDTILDALVGIDGTTTPSFMTAMVDVLFGNGDGTFDPAAPLFNLNSLNLVQSIGVADLNNDMESDFVIFTGIGEPIDGTFKSITTYPIHVVLADGMGGFQASAQIPVNTDPGPGRIADVDGDGTLDLVVANGTTLDVSIFLGNGDGTFQNEQRYNTNDRFGASSGPDLEVADMDGDMQNDIVVIRRSQGIIQELKQP